MQRRKEIRDQVNNILRHNPSRDPAQLQMKKLEALGIKSTLMLDETMDKMNTTNQALDKSNKKLAQSNLMLQRIAIGISILALLISFALGVITLRSKQTVEIQVKDRAIIQKTP